MPLISVIVTVYNHELYLQQCLDSILSQKTHYQYEVIVHDDASTDGSREIIESYAAKYPKIIVPILQNQNQYSRRIPFVEKYILPLVKGKYIAICEGDDYWTDDTKLERQCAYMEEHPECSLCFHRAQMVRDGKSLGFMAPFDKDTDVSTEAVIAGGGGYMATNSIFYPTVYAKMMDLEFFKVAPVGDAPTQAFLATQGTIHYLNDSMSAYRVMAKGSWSVRISQSSRDSQIKMIDQMIQMYELFDQYYNKKYEGAVQFIKDSYIIDKFILMGNYKLILTTPELKQRLRTMPRGVRLTVYISFFSPTLCKILKKIKRSVLCR